MSFLIVLMLKTGNGMGDGIGNGMTYNLFIHRYLYPILNSVSLIYHVPCGTIGSGGRGEEHCQSARKRGMEIHTRSNNDEG